MKTNLKKIIASETYLWLFLLLCAALVCLLPPLPLPVSYHDFADKRDCLGIPYVGDVLSNFPFALIGLYGLWVVRATFKTHQYSLYTEQSHGLQYATLFFSGLVLTSLSSTYYHLKPDDMGLAVDRLGMVFVFAGLLGLASGRFAKHRIVCHIMLFSVLFGMVGVAFGYALNNHLPWTLLQISGVLLLGYSVFLPKPINGLPISLLSIAVLYGIAKLFEWGDGFVFEFTQHNISGHTLKHIVASFVGIPVIFAIKKIKNVINFN